MALLRNYGSRQKYVNEEAGVNSRLDPMQAAVSAREAARAGRLDRPPPRRGGRIQRGIEGAGLILPHVPDWAEPVWHLYVVRTTDRETLQARLTKAGIGTLIHYPIPPHMQAAYAGLGIAPDALPLARDLAGDVLSLPMGPQLGLDHAGQVIAQLRNAG